MTALALAVYAVLLAVAAVVVWRRPVVALYIFVVGLALHNAAMDALYAAGIRGDALTAIQAWKDVLCSLPSPASRSTRCEPVGCRSARCCPICSRSPSPRSSSSTR